MIHRPAAHTSAPRANLLIIYGSVCVRRRRFTTFGGSGPQALDSLAVVPGNSSIFVSGNAWSDSGVQVTSATPTGPTANGTFQAPAGGTKSAFLMQLSAATGASVWLRLFEGHQEQVRPSCRVRGLVALGGIVRGTGGGAVTCHVDLVVGVPSLAGARVGVETPLP